MTGGLPGPGLPHCRVPSDHRHVGPGGSVPGAGAGAGGGQEQTVEASRSPGPNLARGARYGCLVWRSATWWRTRAAPRDLVKAGRELPKSPGVVVAGIGAQVEEESAAAARTPAAEGRIPSPGS